jgi:hypothetical protein
MAAGMALSVQRFVNGWMVWGSNPLEEQLSVFVQIGPEADQASCTTGHFPGGTEAEAWR